MRDAPSDGPWTAAARLAETLRDAPPSEHDVTEIAAVLARACPELVSALLTPVGAAPTWHPPDPLDHTLTALPPALPSGDVAPSPQAPPARTRAPQSALVTTGYDYASVQPMLEDMPDITQFGGDGAAPHTPRYAALDRLGAGGMGEVFRAHDQLLDRTVALKAILPSHARRSELLRRFTAEALATARLDHPGVVPVHDLGSLDDGRPFFTMRVVGGRTLSDVIEEVHAASSKRWERTASGWSLRRLVEAVRRVCDTVAYAHSQAVIHLDLKPANVLVGDYGEITLADWGLASSFPAPPSDDAVRHAGTPAYMAPELLRDAPDALHPAADVYGLGAILHQVLHRRAPPAGPRAEGDDPKPPEELVAICAPALDPDPRARPTAAELSTELGTWLDGARGRARAAELVAQARDLAPQAAALRQRATQLRAEAGAALEALPRFASVDEKRPIWADQDLAADLFREADLAEARAADLCWAALTHAPDDDSAHKVLSDHYRTLHARAESQRDLSSAARWEELLRLHDRGSHRAYLDGHGELSVATDPSGAIAVLYRYETANRRLTLGPPKTLGLTPIAPLTIDRGSYVVELRHPERAPARYPVHVQRGQRWCPEHPVQLLERGGLAGDDCYIAAGPALLDAGPESPAGGSPAIRWVDGFVIKQHPVTNAQYLAFLNDLLATGQREDAFRYAPQDRGGVSIFAFREDHFALDVDADGHAWQPDVPVVMVDWFGAVAYAAWFAARTGQPWRLPTASEWEKAGRGVDGRAVPWGDFVDPNWCCMRNSRPGPPMPAPVDHYPTDASPYGVRGMAGNVRDWCADAVNAQGQPDPNGEYRVRRGGFWNGTAEHVLLTGAVVLEASGRGYSLGFRLARSTG